MWIKTFLNGYCSLIANNGIEGLEVLKKRKVSVILMDLQMPLMDGFCCAQEIRKSENIDIPIISVTANLMDADKARCIDSGMNDFLEEPVKLDVLRSSLLLLLVFLLTFAVASSGLR